MIAAGRDSAPGLQSPGRLCPSHDRDRPEDFAAPAPAHLQALEVLDVAGGLYGNDLALARVLERFDAERGRKRLVFNGDFHWFDADPAVFARVQAGRWRMAPRVAMSKPNSPPKAGQRATAVMPAAAAPTPTGWAIG